MVGACIASVYVTNDGYRLVVAADNARMTGRISVLVSNRFLVPKGQKHTPVV
jgi:hypothetical protein